MRNAGGRIRLRKRAVKGGLPNMEIAMTKDQLYAHIVYRLCKDRSPISIKELVQSFYPHDVEAGHLLMRLFDKHSFNGTLTTNLVDFDGCINDISLYSLTTA